MDRENSESKESTEKGPGITVKGGRIRPIMGKDKPRKDEGDAGRASGISQREELGDLRLL